MGYELRIIPGCPNSGPALQLFYEVLDTGSAKGDIRVIELIDEEQARALNFHGSPSFVADGRDLFPSPAAPALTCRVYQGHTGLSGLPSKEDLQTALRLAGEL